MGDEKKKSRTNEIPEGGIPKPFPSMDGKDGFIDAKKVYALLIGIDHFEFFNTSPGDMDLKGCVRDSIEVERYLKETVDNPEARLHLRKLRSHRPGTEPAQLNIEVECAIDEEFIATRQNIITSMMEFLRQAEEGDIVFIHYSGHGSTEKRPKELVDIDLNADGVSETIICRDSYAKPKENEKRVGPLRDLEIRWLIRGIAEKNPHIIFLSDCCNSSGNSRTLGKSVSVRNVDTPELERDRLVEDFIFYQEDEAIRTVLDSETPEELNLMQGRHVSIAACHSHELAKEKDFKEGRYGVFTYHLLKILRSTKANITYRDLTKLIRTKTIASVKHQSPQSYAYYYPDMELKFMGGASTAEENYYLVQPGDSKTEAIIDAGSLHGILPVSEGKTWVALYPSNANIAEADPASAVAAFFSEVRPHESILSFEEDSSFPEGEAFMKAVVTSSPLVKTKICLLLEKDEALITIPEAPENEEDRRLKEGESLIHSTISEDTAWELVERPEDSQYTIFTYLHEGAYKYRIAEKDGYEAIVEPQSGLTSESVKALMNELEHIVQWHRVLTLDKDQFPHIQPGDIEIVFQDQEGEELLVEDGKLILEQKRNEDGSWNKPYMIIKVELKNKTQKPLYCALLHLLPNFKIKAGLIPTESLLGKTSFIDSGEEVKLENWEMYAGEGLVEEPEKNAKYTMFVPEDYINRGITTLEDHFKLIASTEQFDALHLALPALNDPSGARPIDLKKPSSDFHRLLKKVDSRHGGFDFDEEVHRKKAITDWYTTRISVITKVVAEEEV